MSLVLTAGTFDLLHDGHLNMLERAKSYGSKLVVMVSTDEFNQVKGKRAVQSFQTRSRIIGSLKCVDKVVPETSWDDKIEYVNAFKAEVFIIGDDWKGKFDSLPCKVVYLPRTSGVSSTKLRSLIE